MELEKQLLFFHLTKLSDYAKYHLQANTLNSHNVFPPQVCVLLFSYSFLLIFICSFIFLQNVNTTQII